ncbi:MAG: spermidine/putrescine ABC transporter substrate-binding protein [Oscillospiraceae bacterium]|nr:spermidine/putrescine ABC transporter substrate-binding protein [Oscillospiraceae bacterium]
MKNIKLIIRNKVFLFVFVAVILVFLFLKSIFGNCQSFKKITINVYNWGNHISDGSNGYLDVNAEFEKRTGIQVNYTTYLDNESLFAKLNGSSTKYDVIFPSDYMIAKLIEKDMITKLDFNMIKNASTIDKEFLNPQYDPTNEYSVPYTWGVIGIFYNKKIVDDPKEKIDWDIFWNPKYKGKILMFENSPRDALALSLLKLKLSINTTKIEDLQRAAQEMINQRPLINSYVSEQVFDKIGSGEAALAPYYSDAYIVNSKNEDIGFVVPKSGTNKFVNAMCVPKDSNHKKEAMQYINFICNPDIAVENISHVAYCTPQSVVRKRLDPKVANSELVYPSKEILSKSFTYKNLPDDINIAVNNLWLKTRIDGYNGKLKLILIFLIFILLYFTILIYKFIKKRKEFKLYEF